jgi:dTDP-4-dehydrorhamnose 3,5-epimerase
MTRFDIEPTPLADLMLLKRNIIGDHRGYFERLFCHTELEPLLGKRAIVQINHSYTAREATVRGMHFQHPPHAELKMVCCLRGKVFDVAIDLRHDSKTFLKWHGETLTAENWHTLIIPEGFAHGFQTLTDDCELLYLHTAAYAPTAEAGINPLDPRLGITWPHPINDLSDRDADHPFLTDSFAGLYL